MDDSLYGAMDDSLYGAMDDSLYGAMDDSLYGAMDDSLYGAKGLLRSRKYEVGSIKYSSQRHSMPGACPRSVESPNEVGIVIASVPSASSVRANAYGAHADMHRPPSMPNISVSSAPSVRAKKHPMR